MTDQLLENEMEFDAGAAFGIDQDTVETPDASGPMYPILQWNYGNQKDAAKGDKSMDGYGGWFFGTEHRDDDTEDAKERRDGVAAALRAQGWGDVVWVHDNGSSTAGLWKREIILSVISLRKRWEAYDAEEKLHAYPWKDGYDAAKAAHGKVSSRTHVLVLVKGLEEIGPFTLTLKGSAAMAFEGSRKAAGVLTEMQRTVIAKANAASAEAAKAAKKEPARWPLRCFWLPVGAARGADGKAIFTKVGTGSNTSMVVLPMALGLSKDPDLKRFYVGKELQARTQAIYDENEAWRTAWDMLTPTTSDGESKASAPVKSSAPAKPEEEVLAGLGL